MPKLIASFRCDECDEVHEGSPVVAAKLSDPVVISKTFCSFDCLASWAIAQNAKAGPAGVTT